MNVIVFGATGTVGKHLVQQSLEKGYTVTAFSRNPENLEISHNNLKRVKGDVSKMEDVRKGVENQDAVFVVIGSGKDRKGTVRSEGTKNIIQAMKEKKVNRLICQTTLGCGDSNANLNFFWKNIMFGWFLKEVFLDHELQEEYVRKSGLDWTIVRPGAFQDGAKTGNYKHGVSSSEKKLKLKISRADIADFLIRELQTNMYLLKTPGLSY